MVKCYDFGMTAGRPRAPPGLRAKSRTFEVGLFARNDKYHEGVSENGSKKKTIGFIGILGVVASIVWFALRPRLKSKDAADN